MHAYADSSFLVSLYVPEPHLTQQAIAYMEKHKEALPFTPQHRLEVRNAIRMLVWSRRITTVDRTRAFREIEADLDSEVFLIHSALDYTNTYRRAERIGSAHNESIGCRSADLFHVAAAIELGFKNFVSFDAKQLQIAEAVGLTIDL
jgi:hypothetical protein